jgi:hypothetical protein
MLCLIACLSRQVSDFDSQLDSDQWSCVLWASVPAPDLAQPDPTQSGAPRAPHIPPMRPLSISLSFDFSRAATPSPSLAPLSHLFALGDPVTVIAGFLDPKVSFPLLSLSLSLSPFSFPVRCPCPALVRPCPAPARCRYPTLSAAPSGLPGGTRPSPRLDPVWSPGGAPAPPLARPRSASPCGAPALPRRGPVRPPGGALAPPLAWPPARLAWPLRDLRGPALPRRTQPQRARHLNFSLISFKFGLINVLRRALRRSTIYLKFRFISVLCCTLCRAFSLFNVWCHACSRPMLRFKFSLSDVRCRALRRAMLDVFYN